MALRVHTNPQGFQEFVEFVAEGPALVDQLQRAKAQPTSTEANEGEQGDRLFVHIGVMGCGLALAARDCGPAERRPLPIHSARISPHLLH